MQQQEDPLPSDDQLQNGPSADLENLLNQPQEDLPKSYKQTMKKARDSFMRSDRPEFMPSESLELENLIRGERKSTMKWPTVLDWAPELKANPRLIMNAVVGGIIVATVTVPQSMAYCTMVDFPVKFGVFSCTIALIVYSLFASSKQLSIGPLATTYMMMGQAIDGYTNGKVLAEREIYGRNMAFMIGFFLIMMGFLRLGFIENVFSQPIMMGYLVATGFLIIVDQIPQICNIPMQGQIWSKFSDFFTNFMDINVASLVIGIICCLIFYATHYIKTRKYPKSLFLSCMALYVTIIGTALSWGLDWKTKLGLKLADEVPNTFPPFDISFLDGSKLSTCWGDALKISLVSYTASLLISKQLAKKYNYPINATYEFYGLGLANLVGSFFTALPAFGSLVRSPIIEITGARSQLAGFVTGFTVIIAALAVNFALEQIPITVISAFVVFSCSLVFGDLPELIFMAKYFMKDFLFFCLSFLCCVFLGLANGLIISIAVSMLYVLYNSSKSIWTFKTFMTDEERLPSSEEEMRKKQKERMNTQNYMNALNENEPSPWISNLRRLSNTSWGKNPNNQVLTAFDICLCHDLECHKKCHIMVISFYGFLNYANVKSLKENADFLSLDVDALENYSQKTEEKSKENGEVAEADFKENRSNLAVIQEEEEREKDWKSNDDNNMELNGEDRKLSEKNDKPFSINDEPIEKKLDANKEPLLTPAEKTKLTEAQIKRLEIKRSTTIRGIIFDCSRLEEMDITALRTLKVFIDDMKGKKPKIFVRFAELWSVKVKKVLEAGKYDKDILKYAERDTMSVLFRMCADILKFENEKE